MRKEESAFGVCSKGKTSLDPGEAIFDLKISLKSSGEGLGKRMGVVRPRFQDILVSGRTFRKCDALDA